MGLKKWEFKTIKWGEKWEFGAKAGVLEFKKRNVGLKRGVLGLESEFFGENRGLGLKSGNLGIKKKMG